ncbi:uncharacterized protein EAE97_007859 [Botrytis byssoidea]|uniref:Myb-like DNA-binding domain-containing protein n=1 Tax=Botrytis byssoidea TaxID=139641 RepID=A0A9P5IGI3_9HELO|nr:uncharacterized protein EAE97_007859 [Botrytis byssoidea]KAF7936493.1 hypothetical protein EAE97_007859 [Botrytis byssoidea]
MAPASNEEQFKFLISCIRYSNNGKVFLLHCSVLLSIYFPTTILFKLFSKTAAQISQVDFGQVAKECKIVTKGAAAKRYERMMRSHGIAPNAASIKPAPGPSSTPNSRASAPTSAPRGKSTGKKRKFSHEDENADDEEDFSSGQGPSGNKVKREVKSEMGARSAVKEEMYREDSPSAQLREGMQMQMGLGAGLCDVNRELVGYYSGGSSAAGSVSGEGGDFEFGDGEEYAGGVVSGGVGTTASASGALNAYGQPQNGYGFNAGGYGGMMGGHGMMGSGSGTGSHGGQNMTASRSRAAGSNGMGMSAQQY